MAKTGLVLEGGGQRGIYTAGVLDVFMDNDIEVDGVIGVSAGAIHGLSYVARQRGRNMRYNMKYRNNKHYMSLYSLLTTGDICGEQFCYHDIPEKLDPLDYDAFLANPTKLYVGCSNLDTGEAEYLECTDMRKPEDVNKVRASASLPLVSNIVEVDGMKLLDGGVADSVPIRAFQQMGYEKTKGAFEESLNKLGLTYLDLYLVHMPFGDYYGSWRALEELYQEGKIRAIGVCNFLPDRLLDLCYNAKILPQINQIERHPHYQRSEELFLMKGLQVQPEAWAPFAEGLKGMFTEPALLEIAQKHGKTPAQVILRWNVQQGVIVIPKSVHKERMKENLDIWDFMLDSDDMEKIATLDKDCPSMLDTRKISEVKRVYDYLNNPVLTSL